MSRWLMMLALLPLCLGDGPAHAGDWLHWRGPMMNGHSLEKNLPDYFSPKSPGQDNLIWKQPYGCRSTPIVIDDRLCMIQQTGEGLQEGEQVVCFDANTGELRWKYKFNVFHTDIVSSRLGWAAMSGDKETGYVYAHGTQGFLLCLDKNGKVVWQRQLTEEFGRVTGYGGRITNPFVDEELVIIGMVNASWGNQARGKNRFYAFDKKSGEVVWISETVFNRIGTYYSNPVIGVINGERVMVTGASDGGIHGYQVRTGKRLWSYEFANGLVNGSPIVEGNLIYCTHGSGTLDGRGIGAVICLDGSKIVDGKPTVVWEYVSSKRYGLASAAYADGRLYCPDDFATLTCFNAKTGKRLWRYSYGRVARGSPLIADNKMYVFNVNAEFNILGLQGDEEPEELHVEKFINRNRVGFVETNGTPIAVNGKVYLATADEILCIGTAGEHPAPKYPALPPEDASDTAPAQIQLVPAELTLHPGESVEMKVNFFNAKGVPVKAPANTKLAWTLPNPPAGKGGAVPPALQGSIEPEGAGRTATLTVTKDKADQEGYVRVTAGSQSALTRVRVAPVLPYKEDFENYAVGTVPPGWVNTRGKYRVKEFNGNKVLFKTNNRASPPLARVNAYITKPDVSNYTIAADVRANEVRGKLPDMGLINSRYRLILDGKTDQKVKVRQLRIGSWEAIPRINKSVDFDWKPDTWYRMKFRVESSDNQAILKGKVWERDVQEPDDWSIEFTDPNPHPGGTAALYGFVTNVLPGDAAPGSEIYYDNIEIVPNQ